MGLIAAFHKLTVSLDELLQRELEPDGRQQLLDEVNDLIDKRGEIIHLLENPANDEEKVMMEQILSIEPRIQNRLENNFADLKIEIRRNKKQKTSNQKYSNPYQSVTSYDGMFVDQKK